MQCNALNTFHIIALNEYLIKFYIKKIIKEQPHLLLQWKSQVYEARETRGYTLWERRVRVSKSETLLLCRFLRSRRKGETRGDIRRIAGGLRVDGGRRRRSGRLVAMKTSRLPPYLDVAAARVRIPHVKKGDTNTTIPFSLACRNEFTSHEYK